MVNAAFENGLAQGINFERRLFHGLFGTEDQKEGMTRLRREARGGLEGEVRWRASHLSGSAIWAAGWPRTSPKRGMT